jgi:hypothetical protein
MCLRRSRLRRTCWGLSASMRWPPSTACRIEFFAGSLRAPLG